MNALHRAVLDLLQLCGAGLLTILTVLATLAIYRAYLHPLAGVPGPPLAKLSSVWLAYHVRNGNLFQIGVSLHELYGPAVRVRPNEVWFDSPEAHRLIYSPTGGFEKSNFYYSTALLKPSRLIDWVRRVFPDTLDLLAEFDMTRYRQQRRLIGPIYSVSNLKRYEQAVDDVLNRAVRELRKLDGEEISLHEWMHIITVECLGAISLSWSPGYLRDHSDGASGRHAYMGWRRRSVFGLFPWAVVAEALSKRAGRLFATLWQVTYHTPKEGFRPFFPAVQRKITQRIKGGRSSPGRQDPRKDITADLVQLHLTRPEFTEQYLRRMAITNFGAGHETLTSTLISTMTMIGSRPEVQARIEEELRACDSPMRFDDAFALPYLQASIKEAQRLYPVIGMALPRVVPRSGAQIAGYYLPAGSTVGCNPVSLHRNEDIAGSDASEYKPERWLGDVSAAELKRNNLIYGGGARTCPGKALAEFLTTKIVAALVAEFDVRTTGPPHEDDVCYYFMAMLMTVKARLIPRRAWDKHNSTRAQV